MHKGREQPARDPACATSTRFGVDGTQTVTPFGMEWPARLTRPPVTAQSPQPQKEGVHFTSAHLGHYHTQHTRALLPSHSDSPHTQCTRRVTHKFQWLLLPHSVALRPQRTCSCARCFLHRILPVDDGSSRDGSAVFSGSPLRGGAQCGA